MTLPQWGRGASPFLAGRRELPCRGRQQGRPPARRSQSLSHAPAVDAKLLCLGRASG